MDVIITNLSKYYAEPVIIPPITPDQPNKAVPSDHYGIFVQPSLTCKQQQNRNKTFKILRPLPESLIPKFKIYLSEHYISFSDEETAPEMINKFQAVLDQALSEVFPEKKIVCSPYDVPWFTEELRHLKRRRQRCYIRHGKNQQYLEIKNKFDIKYKEKMLK